MRYYFTGKFEDLEKLGFILNEYDGYWYYPRHIVRFLIPLRINIEDTSIEFYDTCQLKVIKGKYIIEK